MDPDGDELTIPGGAGDTGSLPLPDAFLHFLEENGLDPSIYTMADPIPRYIRVKPGCESQVSEIEDDLKCRLEEVGWLPGFFAIPPHIQIASSEAYRSGKIYGMDAASGAAVVALNVSPGDHVLDLCAAPGAKLCMLSDLLGCSGSITGVDVARHRLAACRTMLQKYALGDCCRLFVADGTTFSLLPLRYNSVIKSCSEKRKSSNCALISTSYVLEVCRQLESLSLYLISFYCQHVTDSVGDDDMANRFTEWTSKRSWKDRKNSIRERNASSTCATSEPQLIFYGRYSGVVGLHKNELFDAMSSTKASRFGYDKVLVDAECTHDGSIKHIQKFEHWGWKSLQRRVLDAKRTDNLMHLQLGLLNNGFRLLKVGGSLVYSTCSLTFAQNEDVVEQFLSDNPLAELQEVDAAINWSCRSGRIKKTLRFDPKTSRTSGLFIAKLTKLEK